jgi:hypothetical protein
MPSDTSVGLLITTLMLLSFEPLSHAVASMQKMAENKTNKRFINVLVSL